MPSRYLDSKYFCEIQATGITESGTNVPWYLSEAGGIADLIGLCYRTDGRDFVICDESGAIISYDIFYFDKANKKIGLVYSDPAQNAGTGLGTKLYCWVGGEIVVENTSNPNTYKNWIGKPPGGLYQILVDHCDSSIAGSCLDSAGNFSGVLYSHGTPVNGVVKRASTYANNISYDKWAYLNTLGSLLGEVMYLTIMAIINPSVSNVDGVIYSQAAPFGELLKIYTTTGGKLIIEIPLIYSTGLSVDVTILKLEASNYSTYFPAGVSTLFTFRYFDANGVLFANTTSVPLVRSIGYPNPYRPIYGMKTPFITFGGFGDTSFNGTLDEKKVIIGPITAKQIADIYNNMVGFNTNATVTVGAATLSGIIDGRFRIRCDSEGLNYNGGKIDGRLRVKCDSKGGVTNTGEIEAKTGGIKCDSRGFQTITGKAECLFRMRIKMHTGKRYNVSIKSRPLYAGPNIENFGEILNAVFNCEFREKISLLITLWSDYQRYLSDGNYGDNEKVISNQGAAGQPFFRQNISIVPLSGFVGTFFQYEIDKSLASNGFFKYFGADIKYIPKPALNPEFLSKLGSIQNGW